MTGNRKTGDKHTTFCDVQGVCKFHSDATNFILIGTDENQIGSNC